MRMAALQRINKDDMLISRQHVAESRGNYT